MKKLFTLLLSCMVVFGLSACTNNNKDTESMKVIQRTVKDVLSYQNVHNQRNM